MSAELQDLGKQLVINCEGNCWVSSLSQNQVTFKGNINSIKNTLEQALKAIKEG